VTKAQQRRASFMYLGQCFDRWIKCSDAQLLAIVKALWPNVMDATRDECLKFLTMNEAEKML